MKIDIIWVFVFVLVSFVLIETRVEFLAEKIQKIPQPGVFPSQEKQNDEAIERVNLLADALGYEYIQEYNEIQLAKYDKKGNNPHSPQRGGGGSGYNVRTEGVGAGYTACVDDGHHQCRGFWGASGS